MRIYYRHKVPFWRFNHPYIQVGAFGVAMVLLGILCNHSATSLSALADEGGVWASLFEKPVAVAKQTGPVFFTIATLSFLISVALFYFLPDTMNIVSMVRRGLFHPSHGNPLNLQAGELLPHIHCKSAGFGLYDLVISAQQAASTEIIKQATPFISAALNHRFQQYAVVSVTIDPTYNYVTFRLDDVKVDHSITFQSVEDMKPSSVTLLKVDAVTSIDLTTSGSMLFSGKTRSGKTTGVIALLLQVLSCGRDNYGSSVVIIDPKQAELSRLPNTVTLDNDGEAVSILEAMKQYMFTITQRQQILNDLSEKQGDAVKWWDAGFNPSFIFIDEYVACRSIFPKKPSKDSDYCLDTFDTIIKRIVTMGASAGCFAIISIAEASVQDGGLPAMLRSAMSTRVLFRPTRAEGLLIWDKQKLDTLVDRVYRPGDAWFSSTDGINDTVSCVHFPILAFPVYRELGHLLKDY